MKTYFVFNIFFFENGAIYRIMLGNAVYRIMLGNCRTVAQATNDNIVHLHCILDA